MNYRKAYCHEYSHIANVVDKVYRYHGFTIHREYHHGVKCYRIIPDNVEDAYYPNGIDVLPIYDTEYSTLENVKLTIRFNYG